jgi:hypothetical protein
MLLRQTFNKLIKKINCKAFSDIVTCYMFVCLFVFASSKPLTFSEMIAERRGDG